LPRQLTKRGFRLTENIGIKNPYANWRMLRSGLRMPPPDDVVMIEGYFACSMRDKRAPFVLPAKAHDLLRGYNSRTEKIRRHASQQNLYRTSA
jgi:hypothetical protein